jgi:phenylacetate-CoA ligase
MRVLSAIKGQDKIINLLISFCMLIKTAFSKFLNPAWWYKIAQLKLESYSKTQIISEVRYHLLHWEQEEGIIQQFQTKFLAKILNYAQKHCAYYQGILKNYQPFSNDFNHFYQLPLLDKDLIRNHFEDIVSDELLYLNHHWKSTSGSTSEPLTFPASNFAAEIDIEHLAFQYHQMGYKQGDKIAVFGSWAMEKSNDYQQNIFWETNPFKSDWHGHFHYFGAYLNEETFVTYINHLNKEKPVFLNGLPSFLHTLAMLIISKKQKLNYTIKAIRLTGENCYDWQIANIKEAFEAPVFLQYGHREIAIYAFSDPEKDKYKYYCSPYYGLTEVLDQDGRHVAEGQIGEIVVTGFFNYAMPFIRYRTNDLAIFGGKERGMVCLERLIGRNSDYVINQKNQKVFSCNLVLPLSLRHQVIHWQIIEREIGKIDINILPTDSWIDLNIEFLKKYFLEQYIIYVNQITIIKKEQLIRKKDSSKILLIVKK